MAFVATLMGNGPIRDGSGPAQFVRYKLANSGGSAGGAFTDKVLDRITSIRTGGSLVATWSGKVVTVTQSVNETDYIELINQPDV